MSDTKIKRPPISESDPAGVIGVPLLEPWGKWGFVPQKFLKMGHQDYVQYRGVAFGRASGTIRAVYPPFENELRFDGDANYEKWQLGWGGLKPPNTHELYLFPQNDNDELVDDELERLDKKELTDEQKEIEELKLEVKRLGLKDEINTHFGEEQRRQKEFELICAIAPAGYETGIKTLTSNGAICIDFKERIAKWVIAMADAMLEAEGE